VVDPDSLDRMISAVGKMGTPEGEGPPMSTHILIIDDGPSHAKPLSFLLSIAQPSVEGFGGGAHLRRDPDDGDTAERDQAG
jgi:hypothetical protein